MEFILTLVGSVSALVGVALGGILTARAQRRSQESQMSFALRGERRDALVQFLASIRQFRRFLMYSDVEFEIVEPTKFSKGTVLVEGRAKYDAALDEAYTRLLIVVGTSSLIEEASRLTVRINEFIRLRAEHGIGNVPNEIIRDFRAAELEFAETARAELS